MKNFLRRAKFPAARSLIDSESPDVQRSASVYKSRSRPVLQNDMKRIVCAIVADTTMPPQT